MEDVKIGRSTSVSEELVTVSNATVSRLAPADPNRIALLVGQPSADGIRIAGIVTPTPTVGLALLSTTDKPLSLTLGNAGAWIVSQVNAIATGAAAVTVLVVSISLIPRTASELPEPSPLRKGF